MKSDARVLSASTMIGDKVRNPAGDTLGKIEEIMFDTQRGRIAYAVLSFGGFLGMGDKLFAIPWKALQLLPEEHAFLLNVDKEILERAPGFDKDDWPDMADPQWSRDIHDYYRMQPYWEPDDEIAIGSSPSRRSESRTHGISPGVTNPTSDYDPTGRVRPGDGGRR
ncbi:MAG: PRC-barrel domain-containing protein [Candidatus Eisenbacteria bacterium]|nr:PRC-barrel domain-containing protein [Candidatus Eisenbacteria bacterium]